MLSPRPVIQSAPGSFTVPVTLFVAGSMRTTLPRVWSLTHSAPPIGGEPVRLGADFDLLHDLPVRDPPHGAVARVRDPRRPEPPFDVVRLEADRHTCRHLAGPRVDANRCREGVVDRPDRARRGGKVEDARADGDPRQHLAGRGVDADHVAASKPADPHAAAARREPKRRAPDLGRRRRPGEEEQSRRRD